ncbi:MAG: hypothetical protein HZB23_08710 [Deltaproteobacteria bacterium]|nr:hypothetical protein [Deltaproteobacteria bacterium]
MHFYWRIFEELKSLGEHLVFCDPSLRRNFEIWLSRHSEAIAMQHDRAGEDGSGPTLQ